MRQPFSNRCRSRRMLVIVLALLLLRAYVPVGYMPAAGKPFQVELCPAAAGLTGHHHHHSPQHSRFDDCPFGSIPAGGPAPQLIAFDTPPPISAAPLPRHEFLPLAARQSQAHRPRGPPLPA
jgi:hypothetical protein